MQAVGIIAEYNPFHNGHAYQASQARKQAQADAVIAVMSGHFTQRGEITLTDKWQRAKAAVCSGVDLVLELPVVFSVRSAQYFASGGVRLLNSLGVVNTLSFGAEQADLLRLRSAAAGMSDPQVAQTLRQELRQGRTYAAALAYALSLNGYAETDFIISPNNILAVEYLRAIAQFAPRMQPIPVQRMGSQYHDTALTSNYSSATAIRRVIYQQRRLTDEAVFNLPPATRKILQTALDSGEAPADHQKLTNILLSRLRQMSNEELRQIPEISEGLQNRIAKAAMQSGSFAELLEKTKTGRYPYARLQRILVHVLLQSRLIKIREYDLTGPLYARVLALNETGRLALKEIAVKGSIPIVNKTTDYLNTRLYRDRTTNQLQSMLALDVTATDLFRLCLPSTEKRQGGNDFCQSAIFCVTNKA